MKYCGMCQKLVNVYKQEVESNDKWTKVECNCSECGCLIVMEVHKNEDS